MTANRGRSLQRLIEPGSVAIIGASERRGAFGQTTLENMREFDGTVHLVNARYRSIDGRPCFASVRELPAVPDCAILAVGKDTVESVIRECAEAGVGAAIVYASGYAETADAEAVSAQHRLQRIAADAGLRLVGPNCAGILNFRRRMGATFTTRVRLPAPSGPSIALVSQSGALGLALGQAVDNGVSLSHVLTAGNSCDVDIGDYIDYLAHDASCRAIACVFEGVSSPQRLIAAAGAACAAGKALIIYKLAISEAGAAAALSHSGSLAGSQAAYRAALTDAGAVIVDHWENLLETASFFAKAPRRKARGVAAIATSGGAAVMAADCAERHAVPLPQPASSTLQTLREHLPTFAAAHNPCDVTAQVQSNREMLITCADALLADDAFGALVVAQTRVNAASAGRVAVFDRAAARAGKPLCLVWLSGWSDGAAGLREAEAAPHLALFRSMDRCFRTLALWHRWSDRQDAPVRAAHRMTPRSVAVESRERLASATGLTLTEREAKEVFALYGVAVVRDHLAASEAQALQAAGEIGYPVALKVASPDIAHKTDAGVVALNVANEGSLVQVYRRILDRAGKLEPAPRIHGVLVQPMIGAGVEIMVGGRVDPLFGPLLIVGMGGVLVELLKDVQTVVAPVGLEQARSLLCGLKTAALLHGFRGSEPVDVEKLADTICRLSEFASDHRHSIQEFDVNPLICSGSRIVAVDALIVRRATPPPASSL